MATRYEPGTVAVATVHGVPDVRVVRVPRRDELPWMQIEGRYAWCEDSDVTDVRPLVVLDINHWDPEAVEALPNWLRMHASNAPSSSLVYGIATAIEAQTRPAKPDEPTGLGAVVKDRSEERWVRHTQGPRTAGRTVVWRLSDTDEWRDYPSIDAVEVLAPGVSP